jgi:SAM-dependent methyltransferase
LLVDWGLEPATDLLEIGCGTGRLAFVVADYLEGGSYTGFDIAPAPIEWLQREYAGRRANLHFDLLEVAGDRYRSDAVTPAAATRFPYDDGAFDLVCAYDVFAHMDQAGIEQYLREAHRVLRPAGRLLFTFMAITDPEDPGTFSGRPFVPVAPGTFTRFPERTASSMAYTWELMRAMVSGSGFEIETTVDGRWHSPLEKREGRVPAADLLVARRGDDEPAPVRRRRWPAWRRSRP